MRSSAALLVAVGATCAAAGSHPTKHPDAEQLTSLVDLMTDHSELSKLTPQNAPTRLALRIGDLVRENGPEDMDVSYRLKTPTGIIESAHLVFYVFADHSTSFRTLAVRLRTTSDRRLLDLARSRATKRLGKVRSVQPSPAAPEAWDWALRDWAFVVRKPNELIVDADSGNVGED